MRRNINGRAYVLVYSALSLGKVIDFAREKGYSESRVDGNGVLLEKEGELAYIVSEGESHILWIISAKKR